MMTTNPISSAGGAAKYFVESLSDYYLEPEGESKWLGSLASTLGVSGEVSETDLSRVLNGQLPDGRQMGRKTEEGMKHRPGYELCFSVPKSVSIMALVGRDDRLKRLTWEATENVLSFIESHYLATRITEDGETHFRQTDNGAFASFMHTTSRELEPQLHIHALLANMTQTEDGVIRALATSRKGRYGERGIERVFSQQKVLGTLFRSELARLVQTKTEYKINTFEKEGERYFDIEGVSDALIFDCSTRRKQIESQIMRMGASSTKAAQKANRLTRRKKESPGSDTLHEAWAAKARAQEFSPSDVKGHRDYTGPIVPGLDDFQKKDSLSAVTLVDAAANACLASSLNFSLSDVINEALSRSFSVASVAEIDSAIQAKLADGTWVKTSDGCYTRTAMLHQQGNILAAFNKNTAKPLCTSKEADRLTKTLNYPTHKAVLTSTITRDAKVQCAQLSNVAGQQMATDWVRIMQSKNRLPVVVVPNQRVADALQATLGIPVHTVTTFANRLTGNQFRTKQLPAVLFLDLPHMNPVKLNDALFALSKKPNWPVVMVGDSRDATSHPFHQYATCLPTCGEVTPSAHKKLASILMIESNEAKERVARFGDNVATLGHSGKPIGAFAPSYVLADVNRACRQALKKSGDLNEADRLLPTYVPFSHAHPLTHPDAYKPGMRWYVTKKIPGLKARQWVSVVSASESHVIVEPASKVGIKLSIDECKKKPDGVICYQRKLKPIARGERLFLTRTLSKAWQKGNQVVVHRVVGTEIEISKPMCDKRHTVDTREFPFFEYDYVKPLSELNVAKRYENIALLVTQAKTHAPFIDKAAERCGQLTVVAKNVSTFNASAECLQSHNKAIMRLAATAAPQELARNALTNTIDLLSTKSAAFTREAIWQQILSVGDVMGVVSVSALEGAITQQIQSGELIAAGNHLVPHAMLSMETAILKTIEAGQGVCQPLLANDVMVPATLSAEQQNLFQKIGQSNDRFLLLQGYPGVGKTYLLNAIQSRLSQPFIGLAVTRAAVAEMEKQGVPSMTVARFMVDNVGPTLTKNHFIVIDEASQLDNRSMHVLLSHIERQGARCLLTGDVSQCKPIGAGNPLSLIFSAFTPFIATDIQRQKSVPLKGAVKAIINQDLPQAFAQLGERVIEVVAKTKESDLSRHDVLATAWLQLPKEMREHVLLPTLTNADRLALCETLRDGLIQEGTLLTESTVLTALRPAHRDSTRYAASLHVNDVVKVVNRADKRLAMGRCYQIGERRLATNSVVLHPLEKTNAAPIVVTLPGNSTEQEPFSVFTKEALDVRVGEQLRCTDNMSRWGTKKHDVLIVTKIFEGAVSATKADGKMISLPTGKLHANSVDYNYVFTVYGVQGKTNQKVIADFPSHPQNADITHFLVGLSRAVTDMVVITNSKETLVGKIQQSLQNAHLAHPIATHLVNGNNVFKPPTLSLDNPVTHREARPTAHNQAEATQSAPAHSVSTMPRYNIEALNRTLTQTLHDWLPRFTSKPLKQHGNTIKVGSKNGSLAITTSGAKAGLWYDFATNEGGNLVQLIQHLDGSDFKDALTTAAKMAHHVPTIQAGSAAMRHPQNPDINTALSDKDKETLVFAAKIAKESVPIEGTLAETYLRQYRKITGKLPETLRFHPKVKRYEKHKSQPALIGIVRDSAGNVSRIQATYLNPKTAEKAHCKVPKQTFGKAAGHGLNLGDPNADTVILCEGIETGLSLQMARPDANVIVSLGKAGLSKVTIPPQVKHVILALDNDGAGTYQGKVHKEIINQCEVNKKSLSITIPRTVGHDFNDCLVQKDIHDVKNTIESALSPKAFEVAQQLHVEVKLKETIREPNHKSSQKITSKLASPNRSYGIEQDF